MVTVSAVVIDMLPDLADDHLLSCLADAKRNRDTYVRFIGHIEQEIWRRMEERGAAAIPDNTYVCEAVVSNTYLQEAFTPLKEVLVEADLKGVLIPAHQETVDVPDKWATAKVLALARRLPEVQAIVDRARQPGPRKLKFEERRQGGEDHERV